MSLTVSSSLHMLLLPKTILFLCSINSNKPPWRKNHSPSAVPSVPSSSKLPTSPPPFHVHVATAPKGSQPWWSIGTTPDWHRRNVWGCDPPCPPPAHTKSKVRSCPAIRASLVCPKSRSCIGRPSKPLVNNFLDCCNTHRKLNTFQMLKPKRSHNCWIHNHSFFSIQIRWASTYNFLFIRNKNKHPHGRPNATHLQ